MNRDLAASPSAPDEIEGVIQSYELAFRMQGEVPELLDISKEPQHVLDAYGVKPGPDGSFARQCLMARRLSRSRRALRRNLPARLGSSQQPAQRS